MKIERNLWVGLFVGLLLTLLMLILGMKLLPDYLSGVAEPSQPERAQPETPQSASSESVAVQAKPTQTRPAPAITKATAQQPEPAVPASAKGTEQSNSAEIIKPAVQTELPQPAAFTEQELAALSAEEREKYQQMLQKYQQVRQQMMKLDQERSLLKQRIDTITERNSTIEGDLDKLRATLQQVQGGSSVDKAQ